ncbi:hypothetical protein ABVK25_009857 [Lepraria finkii]|uniref:Uncharacterized protein n=1 Tax=Lepraria finkii TaxID=1340010 RepID=A0ABR4AW18_9LECA
MGPAALLKTSSQAQNPSLYMAIYDPSLNFTDALQTGYTRMVLINANGDKSINLGLRYLQNDGYPPTYDYSEYSPQSIPLNFGNTVNDTALTISSDLETASIPNWAWSVTRMPTAHIRASSLSSFRCPRLSGPSFRSRLL